MNLDVYPGLSFYLVTNGDMRNLGNSTR